MTTLEMNPSAPVFRPLSPVSALWVGTGHHRLLGHQLLLSVAVDLVVRAPQS